MKVELSGEARFAAKAALPRCVSIQGEETANCAGVPSPLSNAQALFTAARTKIAAALGNVYGAPQGIGGEGKKGLLAVTTAALTLKKPYLEARTIATTGTEGDADQRKIREANCSLASAATGVARGLSIGEEGGFRATLRSEASLAASLAAGIRIFTFPTSRNN